MSRNHSTGFQQCQLHLLAAGRDSNLRRNDDDNQRMGNDLIGRFAVAEPEGRLRRRPDERGLPVELSKRSDHGQHDLRFNAGRRYRHLPG